MLAYHIYMNWYKYCSQTAMIIISCQSAIKTILNSLLITVFNDFICFSHLETRMSRIGCCWISPESLNYIFADLQLNTFQSRNEGGLIVQRRTSISICS